MASMSRESLLNSIKSLHIAAEKLPDDVFADHHRRHGLQRQLTRLKNDITTAFERVFGEICFQVN